MDITGEEKKGPSGDVISWLLQIIEEAGHRGESISIKTDQEEAIMAVKRAVIARREAPTIPLEPKARVSHPNPLIERGGMHPNPFVSRWGLQHFSLSAE